MKEKLAALWMKIQGKPQPQWAELQEFWTRAQGKITAAWQRLTAEVKAVPVSRQAIVHITVGLAAVSLWLVFKTIPGAMAAALSMTMVVAYLALIVAFLAYGGVAAIFRAVKAAEEAAE